MPDGRTFAYLIRDGAPRIADHQTDVRAIQLAKAALYAGVKLLMDRYGADHVERIVLAGAFGSHIDVEIRHGARPDPRLPAGPRPLRRQRRRHRRAHRPPQRRRPPRDRGVVRRIEKIETALEPRFQEHFVNAMALPHKTDAFPNLSH